VSIPKTVTVFDVVACPATPVAHFTVVLAPCMDCSIVDSDLGSTTSFALEVEGCVHVTVNTATDASDGISGGKMVGALVHS